MSVLEKKIKMYIAAEHLAGRIVDQVFLHVEDWQNMGDTLESRGLRPITKKGFQVIQLPTSSGMVDIFADKYVTFGEPMYNVSYVAGPSVIDRMAAKQFKWDADGLAQAQKAVIAELTEDRDFWKREAMRTPEGKRLAVVRDRTK